MTDLKTQATTADVDAFIAAVADQGRREDAVALCATFQRLSGEPPVMWGPSIIGFGRYHYRYDSGREGVMCRTGFSLRKTELVLYLADGFAGAEALLAKLGRHRTGKACLYIKSLGDVDQAVLEALIIGSLAEMDARYPRP